MYRNLSLPFALLLALPTAACLDRGNDSQEVSSAIEKPNGGFDTADEAPAFGDETELAAAAIENDAMANDTLVSDPATIALDQASAGSGFNVIVLWGKMPADRTA